MPFRHRLIHLLMGISFLVGSTCTAVVAQQHDGAVEAILWTYNVPIILVAARACRLAFGRAAQD